MLAAHAPPLFYSCEGRTRGYPTDNEGVSYGQRRKQVTGFVHKHPKLSTNEALVVHGIIPMGETSKGF